MPTHLRVLARCLLVASCLFATTAPGQTASGWDKRNLSALVRVIEQAEREGLDPARYGLIDLRSAVAAGDSAAEMMADAASVALARDMAEGAAPAASREAWHIASETRDYAAWVSQGLRNHDLEARYRALLPASAEYRALREAYGSCKGEVRCSTLRVNLDRWRWLPRSLGARYVLVNVPSYRLELVENGAVASSHKVIVGKTGSPTPAFKASITGVTVNPWWNVPCTIVDESIGKLVLTRPAEAARRGYVSSRDAQGKLQVKQKPGPDNALGQIKIEMPNPYSVFIHDTPARRLFDQDDRALSHGCIRTQNPAQLAKTILGSNQDATIDRLLITGQTQTLRTPQPIPVYVVYFTAEPDTEQPGKIAYLDDLYKRDRKVAAALASSD